MNANRYVAVTLAALAAAVWAASASAGKLPWPGDPRVCSSYVSSAHPSGSDYQRDHCAMHTAAVALRAAKGPAVIKCYRLGKDTTMLRWDCLWGYENPLPYHVIFQQLGGPIWQVLVKYWGPTPSPPPIPTTPAP
jgi:hypothetical protein